MVTCEICGKEFKTPQALNGHVRFKHGTQPAATRATEPEILSYFSNKKLNGCPIDGRKYFLILVNKKLNGCPSLEIANK